MGGVFSSPKPKPVYLTDVDLETPDTEQCVNELILKVGKFNQRGSVSNSGLTALGPVGVGKSSLVNTIASFLTGRLELQAAAGTGTESFTDATQSHILTFKSAPVHWRWRDTPGDVFEELVDKQADLRNGSLTPQAYDLHVQENVITPLEEAQVGCVLVVLSADHLSKHGQYSDDRSRWLVDTLAPFDDQLKVVKHLHAKICQRGMRMMVVLSQVDLVDTDVARNVVSVVRSRKVHLMRQCIQAKAGVPLNQIFPLVNLVMSANPKDSLPIGHLALFITDTALRAAQHATSGRQDDVNSGWDVLSGRHSVLSQPSIDNHLPPSARSN